MSRGQTAGRRVLLCLAAAWSASQAHAGRRPVEPVAEFQTSDRCMVCHNGMKTVAGSDFSVGNDWRASMMANSSRDPYWQASVRREVVDHPESQAAIEDECAVCHMPITRYEAKSRGGQGEVFAQLAPDHGRDRRKSIDGVTCSVCHQIGAQDLGTRQSFNGGFVVDRPDSRGYRPVYGPYEIENGQARIMRSSSEGYNPTKHGRIRQSELCATCHTLYTRALGPGGKVVGELPEQMPYQEWLHSEYKDQKSCQSCHMPALEEKVAITRVLGQEREGVRRHVFVGANFLMQGLLNRFRDELRVAAPADEMDRAVGRTRQYLESQAVRLSISSAETSGGRLRVELLVDNLGGHKLPTGYPSRRVWLHVTVRDAGRRVVFESGGLNADGSIRGNDNDADAAAFEPHYAEIQSAGQVQIYESILGDAAGGVTTGLLTAVRYLKDNRLLPHGFDKASAPPDIAVVGEAAADGGFTGAGDRVVYSVPWNPAGGPAEIEAEVLYQPIGYRWANALKRYDAPEPRRFARYYDAMTSSSAVRLAYTARSTN